MTETNFNFRILETIRRNEDEILSAWLKQQLMATTLRRDLMGEDELREQSRQFLAALGSGLQSGEDFNPRLHSWSVVSTLLDDISRTRVRQGFTPSETATFVFSLKQPIYEYLRQENSGNGDASQTAGEIWKITALLDKLGLYTTEIYQKSREEIIARQQQEMLELSTPVVELWEGILVLPLIGTLDSARTQVVMENLLQQIVETGSGIAIIDITGVPLVDTLVAQHLLKTVAAARLMGAECIISGIRPQIAQTIVHLGVDLSNVTTKGTLASALEIALERSGQKIVRKND